MAKKRLTKESFSTLFQDDFQLTNRAIELAQQQIQAGNEDLNVSEMLEEMVKQAAKNPAPTTVEPEENAPEK
ncbi:MAG: hypothetical protein AAF443_02840 [Chlamydiota bacterium]